MLIKINQHTSAYFLKCKYRFEHCIDGTIWILLDCLDWMRPCGTSLSIQQNLVTRWWHYHVSFSSGFLRTVHPIPEFWCLCYRYCLVLLSFHILSLASCSLIVSIPIAIMYILLLYVVIATSFVHSFLVERITMGYQDGLYPRNARSPPTMLLSDAPP